MKNLNDVKSDVDSLREDVNQVRNDVQKIKDKIFDETPEHFSRQDFIRSFLGTVFVGFTVLFSGNIINMATKLPENNFYVIIIGTIIILTVEIYAIAYSRVKDKSTRRFGQFWLKRITSFYVTAVLVAIGLTLLFGMEFLVPTWYHYIRIVIVMSAPCAIGASIGDMLKKY